jgi:hypothetical protein
MRADRGAAFIRDREPSFLVALRLEVTAAIFLLAGRFLKEE